ncbi:MULTISPECIES: Fur family transcriptional regulator [Nesterenkonia]|uniref:Fur family ferric uptake transcriptional regulator n=2 Tax=Nesterenkonia TaxID=57494 RepID=A0A0W8IGP0_9MICC|nr:MULTISPECIES: Fur family transcriptional regulator [Nesterenkonia]KUG59027.1 peptide ABC transporter substrate-binding protein [Nesterenkonia jeotgali]MBA8921156.1 Fur family ferric uptake transcriptional regulator [Nesterenkonia jeotgali]NYJ17290.1 Fur family ferric uptake transcriptional regulator [Nesterenkonia sandarakina]
MNENTSTPPARGRSTRQKRAVWAALHSLDDFVSAQDLHKILDGRGEKVSLATVYRVLQSHQEEGLVDVLRPDDGEAIFRLCEREEHHHHLVCRSCGLTVEFEAPAIEEWATKLAQEQDFTEVRHTLEIFGLCASCAAIARG